MDSEKFREQQDRLEARYRRAQQAAEGALFAAFATDLSAANAAILENFTRQVESIDESVEAVYRKVAETMEAWLSKPEDGRAKEQGAPMTLAPLDVAPSAAESPAAVTGESQAEIAAAALPEDALRPLSIRALHKLEMMDSHLRHSVVEVCLGNLKMYAQLAAEKSGDERFVEKVLRCVPAFPAAASEIGLLFEMPLQDKVTLRAIFPEQHAMLIQGLTEIAAILKPARERRLDRGFWERFGSVAARIDDVLRALGVVTGALAARRVPLLGLLQEAIALFAPNSEQQGIVMALNDQTDRPASIFADRQALLNAFTEIIRNAHKHAFGESHSGGRVTITLAYEDKDRRRVQISFSDNGKGIPREILSKLGQRGVSSSGSGEGFAMVQAIVKRDHFGDVRVASKQGKGTTVTLIFPVKLDL